MLSVIFPYYAFEELLLWNALSVHGPLSLSLILKQYSATTCLFCLLWSVQSIECWCLMWPKDWPLFVNNIMKHYVNFTACNYRTPLSYYRPSCVSKAFIATIFFISIQTLSANWSACIDTYFLTGRIDAHDSLISFCSYQKSYTM